jgi:hypothetical protein
MPPLQQRYFDVLSERIREDRYPSLHLMDRLEEVIFTPQQLVDYVELLIEKADETWYPSLAMLDRIERMIKVAAVVA